MAYVRPPIRRPRIRLTPLEIEGILSVAGDAFAEETLSCETADEAVLEKRLAAFHRGMEKLRTMLARNPVPEDN